MSKLILRIACTAVSLLCLLAPSVVAQPASDAARDMQAVDAATTDAQTHDAGAVRDAATTDAEMASDAAPPPAPESAPAEKGASDAEIERRLNSIFDQVYDLKEVEARVDAGVVHLTGRTLSLEHSKKAVDLAESIDGVVYVDNQLDEVHEVTKRVSPALQKLTQAAKEFASLLPLIGVGVLILILFWYLSKLVTRWELPFEKITVKPLLRGILRQGVQLAVFLMGVLIVLEIFNITALVGAVLGTAGVAGLVLGFAFRDIAENYLASIILSVYQPFNKNDFVQMDDWSGKVVRLTTRDTVLMTPDGNHLRVPNAAVFKSVITNYTRNPRRRFDFIVGVGTAEDLVDVLRLGMNILKEIEGVMDDPAPFALVDELGDWDVKVHFHGWIDQNEHDFLAMKSKAIQRVKDGFDAAEIDMPAPIQQISMLEPEERGKRPKPAPAPLAEAEEEEQTEVSGQIDSQIEEDREQTDEEDLLDD